MYDCFEVLLVEICLSATAVDKETVTGIQSSVLSTKGEAFGKSRREKFVERLLSHFLVLDMYNL